MQGSGRHLLRSALAQARSNGRSGLRSVRQFSAQTTAASSTKSVPPVKQVVAAPKPRSISFGAILGLTGGLAVATPLLVGFRVDSDPEFAYQLYSQNRSAFDLMRQIGFGQSYDFSSNVAPITTAPAVVVATTTTSTTSAAIAVSAAATAAAAASDSDSHADSATVETHDEPAADSESSTDAPVVATPEPITTAAADHTPADPVVFEVEFVDSPADADDLVLPDVVALTFANDSDISATDSPVTVASTTPEVPAAVDTASSDDSVAPAVVETIEKVDSPALEVREISVESVQNLASTIFTPGDNEATSIELSDELFRRFRSVAVNNEQPLAEDLHDMVLWLVDSLEGLPFHGKEPSGLFAWLFRDFPFERLQNMPHEDRVTLVTGWLVNHVAGLWQDHINALADLEDRNELLSQVCNQRQELLQRMHQIQDQHRQEMAKELQRERLNLERVHARDLEDQGVALEKKLDADRLSRFEHVHSLEGKANALEVMLVRHEKYERLSEFVQSVSLAALDLSTQVSASASVAQPIRRLYDLATRDEFLRTVIHAIPQHVVSHGVASVPDLQTRFSTVHRMARRMSFMPINSGLFGYSYAVFLSFVTVPERGLVSGSTTDAILARADYHIHHGNVRAAVSELESDHLDPRVREVMRDWLQAAKDRLTLEQTAVAVQAYAALLTTSLSS